MRTGNSSYQQFVSRLGRFLAGLLVALLLAACGQSTAVGVTAPTATPGAAVAGAGVAIVNGQAYHTADGGAHWSADTLPAVAGAQLTLVASLDATTRWAVLAHVAMSATDVTVAHTVNDGGQWTLATIHVAVPDAYATPHVVQFLDADHGWLVVDTSHSSGDATAVLYRTTDGGATWQVSDLPHLGVARFISPTTGWLAGYRTTNSAPSSLAMTTDGGVTWQLLTLPTPPQTNGYDPSVGLPLFFGGPRGVVFVDYGPTVYEEVSQDGGATWQISQTFTLAANQAFLGANVAQFGASAWVDGDTALFVTTDDGVTWRSLAAPPPGVTTFGLVSATAGWAETQDGECQHQTNCLLTTTLAFTTDSGQTWHTSLSTTVPQS